MTYNVSSGTLSLYTTLLVFVAKVLGVYLRHDLNLSQHVDDIVANVIKAFICWHNLKSKVLAYLQSKQYSKLSSSIKFSTPCQFITESWLRDRTALALSIQFWSRCPMKWLLNAIAFYSGQHTCLSVVLFQIYLPLKITAKLWNRGKIKLLKNVESWNVENR